MPPVRLNAILRSFETDNAACVALMTGDLDRALATTISLTVPRTFNANDFRELSPHHSCSVRDHDVRDRSPISLTEFWLDDLRDRFQTISRTIIDNDFRDRRRAMPEVRPQRMDARDR